MRTKGKLTTWHDDRGFGFIKPADEQADVFVHAKAFRNRKRRPVAGESVTYEIRIAEDGRKQADNVLYSGEHVGTSLGRSILDSPGRVFAACFILAIAALVYSGHLSVLIFGGYLAMSLVGFVFYWIDKSAARAGRWRIPEATLLMLGLACGWPGALFAQQMLRHKSSKVSFLVWFWITVLINCGLLAVFLWGYHTGFFNEYVPTELNR
jgi:uncharacterized membrane protein YsdA (DUF1294 family)/cold shock CspA family protein